MSSYGRSSLLTVHACRRNTCQDHSNAKDVWIQINGEGRGAVTAKGVCKVNYSQSEEESIEQ